MQISKQQKRYGVRFLPLVVWAASLSLCVHASAATPKIGGGTCTTSMVNGTYFYLLNGGVASGGKLAVYTELGKLVADGHGGVSGQSFSSVGGQQGTNFLSGNYFIQGNCSGTITLTVNSQSTTSLTFQLVDNAQRAVLAISTGSELVTGTALRQTARATPIQCGNGSLSGGYGYLLTGLAPVSGGSLYTDAGQLVVDGNGNGTVTSVANVGGTVSQTTSSGTYTVASDCTGTAQVGSANGTLNYQFAIALDGQVAVFFSTDTGWNVGGLFTPQFAPPKNSVVNGASFQSEMVAPGSLFSIFGTGLSTQPANAGTVPLPNSLGETQVLVNGTPAPLLYVGANQVNAQMPIDVQPGQAVTFTVTNGSTPSRQRHADITRFFAGVLHVGWRRSNRAEPEWFDELCCRSGTSGRCSRRVSHRGRCGECIRSVDHRRGLTGRSLKRKGSIFSNGRGTCSGSSVCRPRTWIRGVVPNKFQTTSAYGGELSHGPHRWWRIEQRGVGCSG